MLIFKTLICRLVIFLRHPIKLCFRSAPHLSTAYPMGLPDWDTVRLTIEGVDGLEGTAAGMPDQTETAGNLR